MKKLYKNGDKNQNYQGDISLLKVSSEQVKGLSFRPLPKEGFVVAVGETTGNKHIVVAEPKSKIEFAEDANGVFIRVLEGFASLTGHKEHEAYTKEMIPLKEQVYFVGRMCEYDELTELRRVND